MLRTAAWCCGSAMIRAGEWLHGHLNPNTDPQLAPPESRHQRVRQLRIAYVTSEYVTENGLRGGLAIYLGRLCPYLAEQGHDVHVFVRSQVDETIIDRGVHIHRVVPWWDSWHLGDRLDPLIPRNLYMAYQDLKAAWALYRKLKAAHHQFPFSAIQLSNVMATGLFFSPNKFPTVMRLSSFKPECIAAGGGVTNANESIRLKLEQWSVRRQSRLFAPSHLVARRIKDVYRKRVEVIESPFFATDQQESCRVAHELSDVSPYALFFGRLSTLKGVDLIANSLPRLFESLPDFHLVLIGDDSKSSSGQSMRDYVLDQARGYSDRVRILDRLDHVELFPIIRNAKCTLLPSRFDNLPNAVIESMGLGSVVVGCTGASLEQLISHGVNGFLAAPDCDGIAEMIEHVWQMDEADARCVGESAGERIKQLHPSLVVDALLKFYRKSIAI